MADSPGRPRPSFARSATRFAAAWLMLTSPQLGCTTHSTPVAPAIAPAVPASASESASKLPAPKTCQFGTWALSPQDEMSLPYLARHARKLDAERVRVHGYVELSFETHWMTASPREMRMESEHSTLYELVIPSAMHVYDVEKACTHKHVLVEGRFSDLTDQQGKRFSFGHGKLFVTGIRALEP